MPDAPTCQHTIQTTSSASHPHQIIRTSSSIVEKITSTTKQEQELT